MVAPGSKRLLTLTRVHKFAHPSDTSVCCHCRLTLSVTMSSLHVGAILVQNKKIWRSPNSSSTMYAAIATVPASLVGLVRCHPMKAQISQTCEAFLILVCIGA